VRVVYFGTGAFGLPVLELIHQRPDADLCGIVTGPDKPQGRGRKTAPTPIAAWALTNKISPVLKPARLKDSEFADALRSLHADVFVVVAYRILPESVFTAAPLAFNLHASLLPAYRGAAPIQRAIMAGETRTGVTTFVLQKTVDTGGILAQRATDIGAEEDAGQLAQRLSMLGAELVGETLDLIENGNVQPHPQTDAQASPAPKIRPEDRPVDFGRSAADVINRVRALSPKPAAIARFRGKMIKLLALRDHGPLDPAFAAASPGEVIAAHPKQRLALAIGGHDVEVRAIQPEGKGVQTGVEFVRGYRIQCGDRFESATARTTGDH
jgi:methionyl-tRNA formyltransferase